MAKTTKKDKEVSLSDVLWNCRNALRGVGSTEKNRDAVIGLAFLKFAGDKFEKRREQIVTLINLSMLTKNALSLQRKSKNSLTINLVMQIGLHEMILKTS